MTPEVPPDILEPARGARRVAVLTGAGMSAESGIPTFRDGKSGLWTRFRPEDLATPQAWARDAPLVWAWYAWRTRSVAAAEPHAGHRALAQWAARDPIEMRVVTQNVDDLHERAGSSEVVHLHGSLFAHRCDTCGAPFAGPLRLPEHPVERLQPPTCPTCARGRVRPDIVWFGEELDAGVLATASEAVRGADLLLVVGTSGIVFPAAGLPLLAASHGVPVIEINPHRSDLTGDVDRAWPTTAAVGLPALVAAL